MLIPNKVLLPFAVVLFAARLLSPLTPWWDSLLGAAVGFGVLFLIAVVSKGGMGGGDIKLFFVIGLVLGTVNTLLTLFLAAFIGTIIGLIMLKENGSRSENADSIWSIHCTCSCHRLFLGSMTLSDGMEICFS